MEKIRINAHAKINLSLRIIGKRADGYHEIVSFMQGTGLHDVVEMSFCFKNGTKYTFPHCTISGVVVYLCTDTDTIPVDMSNLAFKGIKALLDVYPETERLAAEGEAILVRLDKRLPVAAGVAGGSGNAAACMLGLNALLDYPFSLRELMGIGKAVGADVPFSLFMISARNAGVLAGMSGIEEASDSAWIGGIGDMVEAAEAVPRYVILANPGVPVSAGEAYEAMDAIGYEEISHERELFINDMEKYTLSEHPEAAELKRIMTEALDAEEVVMSGSGPTIVAYYTDEDKAASDIEILRSEAGAESGVRMWLTDTGIQFRGKEK